MARTLTLEEVKVGQHDDMLKGVIDEFIKGDFIFQRIPFSFIANAITGGAGWTTSYVYLTEESKTRFRAINGKYEDTLAKKKTKSADVKIYGGSYSIDRALRDQGGVENELKFQTRQLIKAAKKGFSYELINGSKAVDPNSFDGLNVLLRGTKTDIDGTIDLSTHAKVVENAQEFVTILSDFLAELDGKPDVIVTNSKLISKIKAVARIIGLYTATQDKFGQTIDNFDGIPLVALGTYTPEGATPKETVEIDTASGKTSLYAIKFGEDGLFVASPENGKAFDLIVPDFNVAQEQVRGLVELRGVPVLRSSRACGVLRNIKIK